MHASAVRALCLPAAISAIAGILAVSLSACGGGGDRRTGTSAPAASVVAAVHTTATSATTPPSPPLPPETGVSKGFLKDRDQDGDDRGSGYRDSDDARILAYYGHSASVADRNAVTAIARHYFAIATAGSGTAACAMLAPGLRVAVAEDYGKLGARYLRSAKTCAEVLTRMFEHRHAELSVPVTVTAVLTKEGRYAYALIGSTRLPASFLTLLKVDGQWRVDAPFAANVL